MLDVWLQVPHQSYAFRLQAFHQDAFYSVFPSEGFGTQAVEVGPRTNNTGPCLLKIEGVTKNPQQVLEWFQGSYLRRHITRIYYTDSNQRPAKSKGEVLELLSLLRPPFGGVRLQCNPRSLENYFQEFLPLEWQLDPRSFQKVLSVVQCNGSYHWHLWDAQALYLQSPCTVKNAQGYASSAGYKLEEALFHARVRPTDIQIAIDVGAAPGGWTMLLARFAKLVIAVDNADMSTEAMKMPNVVHIRSLSQNAGARILEVTQGRKAEMVVCDMNCHPDGCRAAVADLFTFLAPGALLIITLKFFGCGREARASEQAFEAMLASHGVGECKFCWCLANTVNERTLIARKAAP